MFAGQAGPPNDGVLDVATHRERQLRCAVCQGPIPPGREQYAVLADSSVIDSRDPDKDGRRLVIACSGEHLAAARAAAPQWCDEQLWAGRLARANNGQRRTPMSLAALARRAGLSEDEAQRAQDWRQSHNPAGQPHA